MKCLFFLLTSFVLFVSHVASLDIHVSPQAIASSSTLVAWTRSDTDLGKFQFDLRFFQNDADTGLALANIQMEDNTDFGSTNVVFPSAGTFVLKAVTGPRNTNIGTSNTVQIVAPISSTSASTSTTSSQSSTTTSTSASTTVAVPTTTSASPTTSGSSTDLSRSSTSASSPSSTATSTPAPSTRLLAHPNLPAVVGGVVGSLAFLGLLAALLILLHRRRAAVRRRLTFHRDMMVQRRLSRAPTLPALDPRASSADFARDVEQGLPDQASSGADGDGGEGGDGGGGGSTETLVGPRLPLGTGHIVPSPKGPRPAAKRIATVTTHLSTGSPLSSPRPRPSTTTPAAPVRTRRQQDLADRGAMLRRQAADLQLELDRPGVRAERAERARGGAARGAGDMQRQMVWLREQESAPWALGLTDVLPPGHERYLRP
ncbi:hypothetical protein BJ912DRAFT_1042944 [Pholiota molesta]|nr:hypothetical protein BJ912DRAFT_1042944 [Pholiota molesta]